ncbi:MAG: AI-2E family transporter [Clostridiales Family XIII bacterium]|jgi:predicted PurR-regulated permease PerM|nr:AI-2E family transporter [Clostridiales Family XIII bacterium]
MDDRSLIEIRDARMEFLRKIISIVVLTLLFALTIWFLLDMVLFTFILTFIFYYLLKITRYWLRRAPLKALAKIPDGVLLIFVYLVGLTFASLCAIAFMPLIIQQTTDIAGAFITFDVQKVLSQIQDSLDPFIANYIQQLDIDQYIDRVGYMLLDLLMNIGKNSVNVLIAIALSFLLLLEKNKISKFGEVLGESRISFIYVYFIAFGVNFCHTFAKVMKVQISIAIINTAISAIILAILGFPNILGLAVMIFVLGLVPVAGVIISLFPLSLIAFNVGGFVKVIEVIVMVVVIHFLEAYILNPKLMSKRVHLPVSFVFIILLIAQRYLGIWGLLIGVPLFVFLLNVFDVNYTEAVVDKKTLRIEKHKKKKEAREKAKAERRQEKDHPL